jgi:hypothetical protein
VGDCDFACPGLCVPVSAAKKGKYVPTIGVISILTLRTMHDDEQTTLASRQSRKVESLDRIHNLDARPPKNRNRRQPRVTLTTLLVSMAGLLFFLFLSSTVTTLFSDTLSLIHNVVTTETLPPRISPLITPKVPRSRVRTT